MNLLETSKIQNRKVLLKNICQEKIRFNLPHLAVLNLLWLRQLFNFS